MIVGQKILDLGLVKDGSSQNLKHSTYDLTIGEIVPIGKEAVRGRQKEAALSAYFLEPREMVWVLSREEFQMPADVTGLATLRTTLTKAGILALNVGIVDPLFEGPISTALINFSDRPRRIGVGDKFFRVAFFSHDDVTEFHAALENTTRDNYLKDLEVASYADFSKNFLNVPEFNDSFYKEKFWSIVKYAIFRNKIVSVIVSCYFFVFTWFLIHLGIIDFIDAKWAWVASQGQRLKFW